jgi:hypothetical protein
VLFPLLISLLCALVFYRDLLFEARVYVFRDLYVVLLSREHAARVLSSWSWPPLWNPLSGLGKPFAADIQNAVYYPISVLLRLLPEPYGFNLSIVVHHILASLGLFVLLRRQGIGLVAATVGGGVFSFGGLLVAFDNVPIWLRSAAWGSWTLLAFDAWCDRRTVASWTALILALAMTLLGGQPEVLLHENVLMGVWALDRWRRGVGPRIGEALACLVSANLLCVALLALQLVPFAELVQASSRAGGLNLSNAIQFSLHPLGVLAFIVPRLFVNATGGLDEIAALLKANDGQAPLFLTLYLGIAFVWFGPALRRLSRFQRCLWIAVAALFLALSFGKYLPGYVAFLELLPALRVIRYPEKFLFAVHALFAVATAIGVDRVLRSANGFRSVRTIAGTLAVTLAVGAACTVAFSHAAAGARLPYDLGMQALLFTIACALAGWGLRYPRSAMAALLLLMAGDLYRANGNLLPTVPWSEAIQVPRSREVMRSGESPLRIYANPLGARPLGFPGDFLRERNLLETEAAQLHLIANVNTPSTLNLRDLERWEELIERVPRPQVAKILAAFNVGYVTSVRALNYPGLNLLQAPRDPTEVFVYEVEGVAPRAFVAPELRPVHDEAAALAVLREVGDPARQVAVESDTFADRFSGGGDGVVGIESYLPDRVVLTAEMKTPGLVVLADTYDPGWHATIDGAATSVVRANYFGRGVYVDAGQRRIVFEYSPRSYQIGRYVSLTTCVGLLAMLFCFRAR